MSIEESKSFYKGTLTLSTGPYQRKTKRGLRFAPVTPCSCPPVSYVFPIPHLVFSIHFFSNPLPDTLLVISTASYSNQRSASLSSFTSNHVLSCSPHLPNPRQPPPLAAANVSKISVSFIMITLRQSETSCSVREGLDTAALRYRSHCFLI